MALGLALYLAGIPAGWAVPAGPAAAWRVGILAPRGPEKALQAWGDWRDWLETRFPGERFDLVPLMPDEALRRGALDHLDFLLANPLQFGALDPGRSVRWLATLRPSGRRDLRFLEQIGSAIWVRETGPASLAQLRGMRIGAVDPQALGGYLLGVELLDRAGLEPGQDYVPVFSGFPAERPLLQLLAGHVDAAIVPLCQYEALREAGRLGDVALRLLRPEGEQAGPDAGAPACAASTRTLPGWSLAALDTVPDALATALGRALLETPPSADLPRWSLPVSAADVEQRLRRIDYVSGRRDFWAQVRRLLAHYWPWLAGLAAFAAWLLGNSLWLARVARQQRLRLRRAHEQLHTYEQALARADRVASLEEMAAGIAHEVKQPLSAILQYAEAMAYRLKAETPDSALLPVVQRIRDEVLRCDCAIANLRGWAKPGPSAPVGERRALGALVDQVIGMVRLQADRLGVRIESSVPAALAARLVSSAFELVLVNVLNNAVQSGAGLVTVRACPSPDGAHIEIVDDGPGFEEAHLRFPFVPFRTTRQDGLGLGLLIAQRIMLSLRGQIRLDRRADGGPGALVVLDVPLESAGSD
ncbi:MAG: PhnD/SsuA/transferrin family substrate-binding protein [Castellaniella sp.]|uniref:sensor histidine kinase n=1 Tax=Castellaniella sp. TaxID=1955812 RepID=UPI002A360753|nr:PhnD/SsuA/transferrin family substrate-binding protein [Castellaniella sp.]MDY0310011.1 PhnD/SsuA/transferrin family substrate-binding protein [Castellaniella sp.]